MKKMTFSVITGIVIAIVLEVVTTTSDTAFIYTRWIMLPGWLVAASIVGKSPTNENFFISVELIVNAIIYSLLIYAVWKLITKGAT